MKTFKAVAVLKGRNFGFFNNRRVYDGEFLDVTEAQFSTRWMKRLRKERETKDSKVANAANAEAAEEVSKGLL